MPFSNSDKPIIVLSQCIEHDACRWDGRIVESPFVRLLAPHVAFHLICPERAIGLPTPRDPLFVVQRNGNACLLQDRTGLDLTGVMEAFAWTFAASLGSVDGFLFKSKSPSCGVASTKLFASRFDSEPFARGAGSFATIMQETFPLHPMEEESHMADILLRDCFLTRIFTTASFRAIQLNTTLDALREFHTRYAILLKALDARHYRELEAELAESREEKADSMFKRYEPWLYDVLQRLAYRAVPATFVRQFPTKLLENLGSISE